MLSGASQEVFLCVDVKVLQASVLSDILGDVVNGKWSPDFADHSH